jgi:hypothetical protein
MHQGPIAKGVGLTFYSVATRIGQEPEASGRNCRNWIVRFGKSDGPILLIPTTVRGAADTQ